jgi:hypothetical protein
MTSLYQEIADFLLLLEAVLICGCMTGLIVVPAILIGYETITKRRI